ncbi:HD domain-containing protein [Anaerobacillus isosaccharinicus]|uniref:HD domain-containing protein n=1 Tax=Anaerobacillus isosaccharinicus TaxID=1532552 RepID=A0A1S2LRH5_9BACI|nr:HD domain-containing protein [Anaerobacillus isosaccharinicus]MBA5586953.1 HD domain-containing protein [Anaerobacillus isosaccharinicus]QOY34842.1 HD domain-containing protein [Anaerobacillus isosaccharinicus]
MQELRILIEAEQYVKSILEDDSSGHDWWHIHRVRSLARKIAANEGANIFICELTALLHDLADEKLIGDEEKGLNSIHDWLERNEVNENDIQHILSIIRTMSFKGGNNVAVETLEAKVVQDADRLDALGAIGIGRTFAYAGAKGQLMYDPSIPVRDEMTKEEYRKGESTAINHFYEKLLKLKDLMNTDYGRVLAEERHQYLEEFLQRFLDEWNG